MTFDRKILSICRFFDRFCWVWTKLPKIEALTQPKHYLGLAILMLCSVGSYAADNVLISSFSSSRIIASFLSDGVHLEALIALLFG